MKKRAVSVLLAIVLVIIILPISAEAGTLSNFKKANTYSSGRFSDVTSEWFAEYVKAVYEYDLMGGTSATEFSPKKNLTIAAAIKIAARLHSIYNTGEANFTEGSPWYQQYVDYALENGIPAQYADYNAYATRADFAMIFSHALPDEALTAINNIGDTDIPDVSLDYSYGPDVYKLYRAGILTGNDDAGTFYPNTNITRDAVATIAARMADASYRMTLSLSKELDSTEISKKCSPAVFYIELYDSSGGILGSGSGFFINSSGLAVTNYHVIDGAHSAKIWTIDDIAYDVAGVYDYSVENDLALIQINGNNFPYLELGDSSKVVTGQKIYAIGSPRGFDNTFTDGMVSNASRLMNGVSYIQITAAISHGSSGGALINTQGKVVGVTAAGIDDAQNLNFAIPINLVQEMEQTELIPLSAVV